MNDGYRFKDKDATNRGIRKLSIKGGDAGEARILVQGKGPALAVGALPLMPDDGVARVQIRNEEACWEANFSSANQNDSSKFTARND